VTHSLAEAGSVRVGGVALELREWPGRDVPILLLHEGLGSVGMWRDFPERLASATGRRVIAWSRQGYGFSERLGGPLRPGYMHDEADRVPRLLDALGVDRAVLFGHSDGASIALIAAARYPQRVSALILEAPHVLVEQLTLDSIARVREVFLAGDMVERLGRYHRQPVEMFWAWNNIWLDPRFAGWNIEHLLPAITAPALLIQGLDDEYGTLDQLDRIAAGAAAVRRVELAACGHSPHRDQGDAVLRATVDFLTDAQHA
jgi:pimeloyl-ACP methyl ester carboxylesterase